MADPVMTDTFIPCTLMSVGDDLRLQAAQHAITINPVNRPRVERMDSPVLTPDHLALLTSKYWGAGGVRLTVSFLDTTDTQLRDRILAHMNAWSQYCNVQFSWTQSGGQVRISRGSTGYWSYLGTDILQIPAEQPTMNLQWFTANTPESEYKRVVRHETGHTLGYPHEHMRMAIIQKLDRNKTIAYFRQTQGWSAQMVVQQVLTPLEESSLMQSGPADVTSIMCYQLPGSITIDGQPIPGGTDIDQTDIAFAARVYPSLVSPPPPPVGLTMTLPQDVKAGTYTLAKA